MQAFAADPDVEYIEIDGVVSIMPVGGGEVR
jgi:serine protease